MGMGSGYALGLYVVPGVGFAEGWVCLGTEPGVVECEQGLTER